MAVLYERNGTEHSTHLVPDSKGRATSTRTRKCTRCGGAGGHQAWAHTGYKCYRCGGSGVDPQHETVTLYTAERLAKLNEATLKREDKARAKAQALADQSAQEAAERKDAFLVQHAGLLAQLAPYADASEFVASIVQQAHTKYQLSEGQVAAATRYIEQRAALASSSYQGSIGDRVRGLAVTCTAHNSYASEYGVLHISSLVDERGNRYVVKSGSWWMYEHEVAKIDATVKAHSEYKGCKQTVLARVKGKPVSRL